MKPPPPDGVGITRDASACALHMSTVDCAPLADGGLAVTWNKWSGPPITGLRVYRVSAGQRVFVQFVAPSISGIAMNKAMGPFDGQCFVATAFAQAFESDDSPRTCAGPMVPASHSRGAPAGMGVVQPPLSAGPVVVTPATPFGVSLTNDLMTCTQHAPSQQACERMILDNKAILVWSPGTSCRNGALGCTTQVDGYHVYWVPPPSPAPPAAGLAVSPGSVARAGSSGLARSGVVSPSGESQPALPKRSLIATVTRREGSVPTTAALYPGQVVSGHCISVAAFMNSGVESEDSTPSFCPAGPGTTGPVMLDLKPTALVTAYGHTDYCSAAPPFGHPAGSILAGYTTLGVTNDYPPGHRCRQYEGLIRFDLGTFTPPFVYKAVLQYSKVQNYNSDGSPDSSEGICPPILYDTTDNWDGTDPRNGLVNTPHKIDSDTSDDFYHTDVTKAVNTALQAGTFKGFVMKTTDWNGPGSSCFTAFGSFHLVITAFGHH